MLDLSIGESSEETWSVSLGLEVDMSSKALMQLTCTVVDLLIRASNIDASYIYRSNPTN